MFKRGCAFCSVCCFQQPSAPWILLQGNVVDMEEEFLNLGLDIIGMGVFNYKFGSITTESPVIKASLDLASRLSICSQRF